MDDLDRSLVELRRVVIDGAIQAEVGRWRRDPPSAPRRARAQGSASPVGVPSGGHPPSWRRVRGTVIAVIVGALTLLLML